MRFEVLLADAAARAGALHRREVDAVFLRHAANERRAVNARAFASGSGLRGGRWAAGFAAAGGGAAAGFAACCVAGAAAFAGSAAFAAGAGAGAAGLRRATSRIDHANNRLNRHRLAFADFNFLQHARRRRRNFRVDLIGGDFKQRLVALDFVAGLLQPLRDGAFKNAFAHLGHYDVNGHVLSPGKPNLQIRSAVFAR